MKPSFFRHAACTGALLLSMMACADAANTAPKAATADGLMAAIQAAVGDAACDGPQHCRSIAVGAKPCGGPDGFLAWSSKRTDEKTLRSLVEQHAALRKQENLRNEMSSTCEIETNPGVVCQAARCTLLPRGQGSVPLDPR
ncbi:MAG: hypothetical protein V4693_08990 [Pseudomonadota bacterium]